MLTIKDVATSSRSAWYQIVSQLVLYQFARLLYLLSAGYAEIVLAYRSIDKKAFILFTLELSSPPLLRAVISAVKLVEVHFLPHELTAAFELGTLCGWTRMCWHLISSKTTILPVKFFFIDLYLSNNLDDFCKIMSCRTTSVYTELLQFESILVSLKFGALRFS